MDTETDAAARYFVLPDADGDLALWRGTSPDDNGMGCVAYKYALDKMDEALWPALVEHWHARTRSEDYYDIVADVRKAYQIEGLIPAIRLYRSRTGAGLRGARTAVQLICAGLPATPDPLTGAEPG